jgi:glycosyltransferase involved in cell wall biosynthesis
MIKVLHIIETIGSGGVERRRLSLAKLLDSKEFELKIICTQAYGIFPNEFKKHGVEIIEIGKLKSMFDIKQHRKVCAVIDEFKPDIIHGAVFEGVTMAAINGFYKKVPNVIIEETSDPQNRSWRGNLLMKFFCSLSHKVIGVSPAATNYLMNTLKINSKKIVLINNGVALPRISDNDSKQKLRADLGIANDDIVIGTVGRMHSDENKRFSDLIRAFAILTKDKLSVKLLLVGDGREKENYANLVKELSIESNVIFVGYQNDTQPFYSIMDVFSLVSSHESFGLVLAEAMLHNLPIVATKVGGMQYIVDDNQTGFLVEKYNVNEIAQRLGTLCGSAELREKMGALGYKKAIKNYTEERYISRLKKVYHSLKKNK